MKKIKRDRGTQLENKALSAFKDFIPEEWELQEIKPDYGIDRILIFFDEYDEITNKTIYLQFKSTKSTCQSSQITYRIKTKYLNYYENNRNPVILIFYLEPKKIFYYIFIQQYIKEILNQENGNWRNQKTVTLKFKEGSILESPEILEKKVDDWFLYVCKVYISKTVRMPVEYLDGIPNSDNEDLKKYFARAQRLMHAEKYKDAIINLRRIINVHFTVSFSEKLSVLLNLGVAFFKLGNHKESLQYYKEVIELSDKNDQKDTRKVRAAALTNMGILCSSSSGHDRAVKYFYESLMIAREVGYNSCEVDNLINIANVYILKRNFEKAQSYIKDAFKISKMIKHFRASCDCISAAGVICALKGKHDTALENFKTALDLDKMIDYRYGELSDLANIAEIYKDKGNYEAALEYFEDALVIARKIEAQKEKIRITNSIGQVYQSKGEFDTALEHFKEVFETTRVTGSPQNIASSLSNIAQVYFSKGDYDISLEYFKKTLDIVKKIGNHEWEIDQLRNIGMVYNMKGEYNFALNLYLKALEIAKDNDNNEVTVNLLGLIGTVYLALRDYDTSLQFLFDAKKLSYKYNIDSSNDIIEGAIKFALEQ